MTGSFRRFRQGALGVLLFGAVLSPAVAELLGRPAYPRTVTAAATSVALVLAAVMRRSSQRRVAAGALYAGLALVAAVPLAIVQIEQRNAFYTSGALLGGMVILLGLHVAAVAMRRVGMRDDESPPDAMATALSADRLLLGGVERLPPNEIRVVRTSHTFDPDELGRWRQRADAAPTLDDALADTAAWLLVAFWLLVALGRRHVASVIVLLIGAIFTVRCLVLLPGVLATRDAAAGTERA